VVTITNPGAEVVGLMLAQRRIEVLQAFPVPCGMFDYQSCDKSQATTPVTSAVYPPFESPESTPFQGVSRAKLSYTMMYTAFKRNQIPPPLPPRIYKEGDTVYRRTLMRL